MWCDWGGRGRGKVTGNSGRGAANEHPTESLSTEGEDGGGSASVFSLGARKMALPQSGSSSSVASGPAEPGMAGEAALETGTGGHGCDFLYSWRGHPGEPCSLPAAAVVLPGSSWWPGC